MSIREKLGLGPKTADRAPLIDNTFYEAEPTPEQREAEALEAHLRASDDPVAKAALQLDEFELSVGARSLIDRALDSLSKNTGAGLADEDARTEAVMRAELTAAAGNNLSVVIDALASEAGESEVAGMVYSYLYAVMKNCVFFANLDYRQAQGLDTWSDDAIVEGWFTRYVSDRYVTKAMGRVVTDADGHDVELAPDGADHNEAAPPSGCATRREIQLAFLRDEYGTSDEALEETVVRALYDVRLFFQLTAECYGWNPDAPMPFGNTPNPDGSFTAISDAEQALDAAEIRRQASRKKRAEQRRATSLAATARAKAILARTLK